MRHVCGTSGAAALASHFAGRGLEEIKALRASAGSEPLDSRFDHVLIKALLAHGCSWAELSGCIGDRETAARFLGYGLLEPDRIIGCTEQRATMIGCGELGDGEAHIFEVPLPPSLIGTTTRRSLRLTLAWMTPTSASNRRYRHAAVWFDPTPDPLRVQRTEVDGKTVLRGTLQHEILVGDQASAYIEGTRMSVQVNCREDAPGLVSKVPYALLATIEVAANIDLPIYTEIRDRLGIAVAVEE
jgi:hypothetical protein